MILLAMVFALLLDAFVPYADRLRLKAWHWLEHNALVTATKGFPAAPLVVTSVVILVVPLLLLMVKLLLPDFSLLTLAFETLGLWFALGPRSFYQELQKEDGELSCSSVLRWRKSEKKSAETRLISEAFYRVFLPLLWFVIGGAVLASAVRALVVFCDQHETLRETDEHALIKFIDWVMIGPAWLLVLSFGLMGRLSETWYYWRDHQEEDENHVIHRLHQFEMGLTGSAIVAVGEDNADVSSLSALLQRTLLAWLAITALFTLGGVIV